MTTPCIDKLAQSLLRIRRWWLQNADSVVASGSDSVLGTADREAAMRRLMEHPDRKPRYDGAGQPS